MVKCNFDAYMGYTLWAMEQWRARVKLGDGSHRRDVNKGKDGEVDVAQCRNFKKVTTHQYEGQIGLGHLID